MRVPVFYGLRSDKPANQIGKEVPKHVDGRVHHKSGKAQSRALTHPDKIIYAKEGITKEQVDQYYRAVCRWILPHIQDRPLSMVRCPQGSTKPCFFSKHFSDRLPPEILSVAQDDGDGKEPFIAIDSSAGLHTLVQRGTLEIHPWQCHRDNLEAPDQIVMDFDPDPGVDFEEVKEGVWELKEILDQLKLKTFLKTTGGKGLHIQFPIAPIYTWDQIKEFTRTLAKEMESRFPKRYTSNLVKKARKNKIFVDYLRNGRGATAVAPYSLRAREFSAIAMPIEWDALESLPAANVFTMEKAIAHLERRKKDPWADFFKVHQEIEILKAKGRPVRRPRSKSH